MLKLHEYNETDFTGGCLAYLGKAVNVAVTENLQQAHTLSFEYPMNDDKADMIQENRIVSVEGQAYRLKDVTRDYSGTRILKAKAERIFFIDARFHHIPTIGNDTNPSKSTIGVDPYKVIELAVEGTRFELIPDSELAEMGMTRIGADGVLIDFLPTDKINTYDVITSVIDAVGYGELYVDNYRIAVVERIGKDNGVRLSLKKNLQKLSVERQISELTTRLYPYGADDLTISSVNGGVPYIQSDEAVEKYGIVDGYKDYTDYTDPEKLMAHAKWDLMGDDNDFRLDTPQLTITGDVIDLSKLAEYGDFEKITLGDTVHVYEDKTVHHKRIINITYYPYSAKQPTVTIGVPSNTNRFYAAWQKSKLFKVVKKNRGTNNKIKTTYFTGTVNSTQNPVKSENNQLLLDGDLLYIEDNNKIRRIEIGNVGGEFVFNLYDPNKKQVIHFDENGNGIFSGTIRGGKIESDTNINVNKDASIGQYLKVGYISSYVDDEGITHYEWQDESGIMLSGSTSISTSNKGSNLFLAADAAIELNATKVMIKKERVLTEADLRVINDKITELEIKIAELG